MTKQHNRAIHPLISAKTGILALLLALGLGCGTRKLPQKPGGAGDNGGGICIDSNDCGGFPCIGGVCDIPGGDEGTGGDDDTGGGDTPCSQDYDCAAGEYCHFPSTMPWSPDTLGVCDSPCGGECGVDNGIYQTCHDGQCYTEIDCDPANLSSDCPPGEVCNVQTRSCTAPPEVCYFADQCPANWVCGVDGTCIDPNDVDLGGCTANSDCDSYAGCENGGCTCNDGACQPIGGCVDSEDCPDEYYCANSACVQAPGCVDGGGSPSDVLCNPYNLVCNHSTGFCENPQPCESTEDCDTAGFECITHFTPPACYPEGTGCTRDEQCSAGNYCDVFSSQCAEGCRNDSECAANSPSTPFCDGDRDCVADQPGGAGEACESSSTCTNGLDCVKDNLLCFDAPPFNECDRHCLQTCDWVLELIFPSCPSGTTCRGEIETGDALVDAAFNALFDGTGGYCYND